MHRRQKKLLIGVVALAMLFMSVAFALQLVGKGPRPGFAQSSLAVTDFYVPAGQDPWGTTFDSHGNLWVAVPGCDPSPTCSNTTPPGKIAEYNPAASSWAATYQLPAGFAQALFLAFDAQGNLWFPLPMANSLGMLNLKNNTYQQWVVPTPSSGPWDIAIDHNGKIWFTEHYSNKIGKFDPTTQTFTEIATPATNSVPYGITVDGANNIWFTENSSAVALIGEYTAGGVLKEYKIRNSQANGLTPHLITVAPGGNIWWSEGFVAMIGELNVAKAVPGTNNGVTEYHYPTSCSTCGSHTSGIAVDSNGLVWFDDSLQNIFGSFPDSGQGSFSVYATPTQNGHPHDGLNVDSQNRVWFDEEFANKVAKAVQTGVPVPTTTPTSPPSPTFTPSPSPTLTPSPSPTSTPGSLISQDTFQRANQTFWGTASDGQKWGGDANSSKVFSIKNNAGEITNGGSIYNAVLGVSATNAGVLFSGSLSSYNNSNLGAVLRWTDGNNWYKAYIDGSSLVIQKKVKGSVTTLQHVAFAATAGTSYTLRFSIVGTTLSAKIWKTGTAEPANWMATATDGALASGFCGLRIQAFNGASATITSFEAISQ